VEEPNLDLFLQREKDIPFVNRLISTCLIEEYGDPSAPENITNLLDYYYSKPDSVIFVLEVDSFFAGFVWLIESSDVVVGNKFYCVLYIALEKHFRGRGFSKILLEKAVEYCRNTGDIQELRLTVRKENEGAFNLYSSFGFKTYKHEMKLKL